MVIFILQAREVKLRRILYVSMVTELESTETKTLPHTCWGPISKPLTPSHAEQQPQAAWSEEDLAKRAFL